MLDVCVVEIILLKQKKNQDDDVSARKLTLGVQFQNIFLIARVNNKIK